MKTPESIKTIASFFKNPNKNTYLYGKDFAQSLNGQRPNFITYGDESESLLDSVKYLMKGGPDTKRKIGAQKLFGKLLGKFDMTDIGDVRELPANTKPKLVDILGLERNLPTSPTVEGIYNKQKELELFKNYVPRSVNVSDIAKNLKIDPSKIHLPDNRRKLTKALGKEFGEQGYIVKAFNGVGTEAGSTFMPPLDSNAAIPFSSNRRYFAQKLEDTEKVRKYFGNKSTGKSYKEYRVHTIDGKVVPYATFDRFNRSPLVSLKNMLVRDKNVRAAEELAQNAINSLPANYQNKRTCGMDIGINAQGKPFFIEGNMTRKDGMSGFLMDNPLTHSAISGAIRGKTPAHVLAARGAVGTAAAGTTGGVAYALTPSKKKNKNDK